MHIPFDSWLMMVGAELASRGGSISPNRRWESCFRVWEQGREDAALAWLADAGVEFVKSIRVLNPR